MVEKKDSKVENEKNKNLTNKAEIKNWKEVLSKQHDEEQFLNIDLSENENFININNKNEFISSNEPNQNFHSQNNNFFGPYNANQQYEDKQEFYKKEFDCSESSSYIQGNGSVNQDNNGIYNGNNVYLEKGNMNSYNMDQEKDVVVENLNHNSQFNMTFYESNDSQSIHNINRTANMGNVKPNGENNFQYLEPVNKSLNQNNFNMQNYNKNENIKSTFHSSDYESSENKLKENNADNQYYNSINNSSGITNSNMNGAEDTHYHNVNLNNNNYNFANEFKYASNAREHKIHNIPQFNESKINYQQHINRQNMFNYNSRNAANNFNSLNDNYPVYNNQYNDNYYKTNVNLPPEYRVQYTKSKNTEYPSYDSLHYNTRDSNTTDESYVNDYNMANNRHFYNNNLPYAMQGNNLTKNYQENEKHKYNERNFVNPPQKEYYRNANEFYDKENYTNRQNVNAEPMYYQNNNYNDNTNQNIHPNNLYNPQFIPYPPNRNFVSNNQNAYQNTYNMPYIANNNYNKPLNRELGKKEKEPYEQEIHRMYIKNANKAARKVRREDTYTHLTYSETPDQNYYNTIYSGCESSDYNYLCTICDKRFKRLSTLKIHILSHIKDASLFWCPDKICNYTCKSQSLLLKHINEFHRYEKVKMEEYLKRNKFLNVFRTHAMLIDYYNLYLKNVENPFLDSFCYDCFTYPKSLTEHPCSKSYEKINYCPCCTREVIDIKMHIFSCECRRMIPILKESLDNMPDDLEFHKDCN